jgi:hypothetical protein
VIDVVSEAIQETTEPAAETDLTPAETVDHVGAQAPDVAPVGTDLATTPTRAKKTPLGRPSKRPSRKLPESARAARPRQWSAFSNGQAARPWPRS